MLLLNKKVVSFQILILESQQHDLAFMSKCNFSLISVLKWNTDYLQHMLTSVWYLILGKILWPGGHFWKFKREFTQLLGNRRAKLLIQRAQNYKPHTKNCMEWICAELESIWDPVQEFVVQISLMKWKEARRINISVSMKDYGGKKKEEKKRNEKEMQQAGWGLS